MESKPELVLGTTLIGLKAYLVKDKAFFFIAEADDSVNMIVGPVWVRNPVGDSYNSLDISARLSEKRMDLLAQ